MTFRILIDANVPIYVFGRPHPLQEPCRQVVRVVAESPDPFFTSAEVLQELLHRYVSIRQWPMGRLAVEYFAQLLSGRIEPLFAEDVLSAAIYADRYPRLSARDLVHLAVGVRMGATHIVSADAAFDAVNEVGRLDPLRVDEWRERIIAG